VHCVSVVRRKLGAITHRFCWGVDAFWMGGAHGYWKTRRWCAVELTAGFESVGRIRRRELGELANVVVVGDETVG
jgi:hypothetical protein